LVRSEDIAALDGRVVAVVGVYRAIPVPTKGRHRDDPFRLKEDAVVVLEDGSQVFLEPYVRLSTSNRQRIADAWRSCAA
jgi:hypothetical protein